MAAGTSYPCLHTSKRMHFIEDLSNGIMGVLVRSCIRMHFIEERCHVRRERCGTLAYVKTYALH